MKFVFGVAVGALGMWAYQGGKLQNLLGMAPEPVQEMIKPAVDQFNHVAQSEPVRQATAMVQDKVQQATATGVAMPTASEVSGRPSEPLPGSGE